MVVACADDVGSGGGCGLNMPPRLRSSARQGRLPGTKSARKGGLPGTKSMGWHPNCHSQPKTDQRSRHLTIMRVPADARNIVPLWLVYQHLVHYIGL
jgi:hypothetical protein